MIRELLELSRDANNLDLMGSSVEIQEWGIGTITPRPGGIARSQNREKM
ncbi:hypothetical protein ACFVS7_20025 [Streptomyces rubiginosohelvolus]